MGQPVYRFLYQALRLLLVTVFLWSGLSKALHPDIFAETIAAYGLLPPVLIWPVAVALLVVEIIAAVGLLLEKRGALAAITLMMVIFLAVLGYGIYLGLDIDCGCFGPDDPEAHAFHDLRGAVIRDLLIVVTIAYLYVWRFFNRLMPRPWLSGKGRQVTKKENSI